MNSKAVQKLTYPIALILSTTGKKTAESLAKIVNKSGDKMLRLLEHNCANFEDLLSFAHSFFKNDDLYLIIDDTLISKMYSEVIEGTSDNYDSSNNRKYRSLCSITAMLTNGKYGLPLDTKMWVAKELAQDQYKTKLELAQELILRIKGAVTINSVIMDGLNELESKRFALLEYKPRSDKALLADLVINNPKASVSKVLQLFGLKKALETVTLRELRTMFSKYNQRSWYRLMADAHNIKLPVVHNAFETIRDYIIKFKPTKLPLIFK